MRRKKGFSSLSLKWLWRGIRIFGDEFFLFFSFLFYTFGLLFSLFFGVSFLFSLLLMCGDLRRIDISKSAANELDTTLYTKLI